MTTSLGGFVVLIEDFRLYIYIYLSLFVWVGFSADVSGGLGTCHHIRFWGVTQSHAIKLYI